MKLSDRLELEWRTLEAGEARQSLRRTLLDLGLSEKVHLGSDSEHGRELHFQVANDIEIGVIPAVHGVRLFVRNHRHKGVLKRFLVLRCALPESYRVFTLFAADVLEQVAATPDVARKALEVLSAWREMFRRVTSDSESRLRGVFGEMHELALIARHGAKAVHAWRGPEREPQDFQRGNLALEVKSSKWLPNSVEVHGLQQLWASPFDALVLAVKQVTVDNAGLRIDEFANELIQSGLDSTLLWDKLERADLPRDRFQDQCGPRFTVQTTRYYLVTQASPVLTPDSLAHDVLPVAVSKLSYQLDLGALTPCAPQVVESVHRGLAVT